MQREIAIQRQQNANTKWLRLIQGGELCLISPLVGGLGKPKGIWYQQ